jgi:anti-sigma factor RsiW
MSGCDRFDPRLGAYRDGELGAVERWRVRRHLTRCRSCRESLDALSEVGSWVRAALQADDHDPGAPDLWTAIAAQLPIAATPAPTAPRRPRRGFAVPAGAGVLAAAAAAGFLLLRVGIPNPPMSAAPAPAESGAGTAAAQEGVVRSLNTHGRPVMVLDGARDDATIIWLMDDGSDSGSEDASRVWI